MDRDLGFDDFELDEFDSAFEGFFDAGTDEPRQTGDVVEVDTLSDVWGRIHARIEARLHPIELEIARLIERPVDQGSLNEALSSLHDLATWLGELGMIPASRLARQITQRMSGPDHLLHADPVAATVAAGLVEDLRSSVATTAGGGLTASVGEQLLMIGEPGKAIDSLVWYAVTSGFTVRQSTRLQDWPARTDGIVIGAQAASSSAATLLSSRLATERYPGVPVVVVGGPDDPAGRCDLAMHSTSLLPATARPAEVIDEVRRQILVRRISRRVVVRGEGRALVVAALLERGIDAFVADDDRELLSSLESGRASGVVLLPAEDNARVARLLRAQSTTRRCVIVEVQATDAPATHEPGIDATIESKGAMEATARTLRSLYRLRLDVDADLVPTARSGGIPWASAVFLAERLLLGAHRSDSVASLCVIRFDESSSMSEVDAVQDQLLREFRTDDIVTRSGDREAVVVLSGVDHTVSQGRLEAMASRVESVGVRVGVAEFPYDAQSVDDLVTVARGLLERSIAEGGPRVVTADWHPGGLVAHDVIIADSDPAIARVIGDALARSGLSVDHLTDGQVLLERLENPLVRLPRLLLLEFDLLTVDGLTILRRLQRKSALRRFDVVMLSSRTRETDLREAYDLGASEVIQKPFSPGILVRRLLRILEDGG